MNEFRGKGVDWAEFNSIAGGFGCPLARRGLPDYQKWDNLPVMVLGNRSIGDVFGQREIPSVPEATVRARFLEVEVPEGENPFPLMKT